MINEMMVEAGSRADNIYGVFLDIVLYLNIRANLYWVIVGLIGIDSITRHTILLGCSFITRESNRNISRVIVRLASYIQRMKLIL